MDSRVTVLYISIIGMGEPLGKSQVLEYLKALSQEFAISLHSFEKDASETTIKSLQALMAENNINWSYQLYSNRFGVLSSFFQIVSAYFSLMKQIRKKEIQVVHARSLIPVMIALLLKCFTGVKVIFDIRGFQTDEKAEVGRIKPGGFLYKILKFLEKLAYRYSDSIVSLTHNAKAEIGKLTNERKIVVIPTCANANVFKVCDKKGLKQQFGYQEHDRIIVHVGTVGNWYDFDAELNLLASLMSMDKDIKFLVLNKGEHQFIKDKVAGYKIATDRFRLVEADFYEVYKYLNMAEASIFIIKPTYSKKASAPTKFAENLRCQLYSITNDNIGDMDYFISSYSDVGYSFPIDRINTDIEALSRDILKRLESRNKQSQQFKALYEEAMSNTIAVEKYSKIYRELSMSEKESFQMKLVVFDVCGTLYDSNTTFEFLDYYFEGNHTFSLFRRFSCSFIGKLLNYPFRRFFHYDLTRSLAIAFLRGEKEHVVSKSAEYFVYEQLEQKINKRVSDLYDAYAKDGYTPVLMSGSLDCIIKHVAKRFKADAYFASTLAVKNETLVGVYAEDKLFNKKDVLLRHYPDIQELVVVTDNLSDLDLVKHANKAHIICNKEKHKNFWLSKKLTHLEFVE